MKLYSGVLRTFKPNVIKVDPYNFQLCYCVWYHIA